MIHYHIGHHTPGCLPGQYAPDGLYEDVDWAWRELGIELDRHWDEDYWSVEATETADRRSDAKLAIDGRYLPANAEIHNHPNGPGEVSVPGPTDTSLGLVYFVAECSDETCTETE